MDRSDVVDVFTYNMLKQTTRWTVATVAQARSNLAGLSVPGRLAAFAGGTARAPPAELLEDAACAANCLPADTRRHGLEAVQWPENKIHYPYFKRSGKVRPPPPEANPRQH